MILDFLGIYYFEGLSLVFVINRLGLSIDSNQISFGERKRNCWGYDLIFIIMFFLFFDYCIGIGLIEEKGWLLFIG